MYISTIFQYQIIDRNIKRHRMKAYKNWFSKRFNLSKRHLTDSYGCARNTYTRSAGKEITLIDNKKYLEFISCSYLGLHNDRRIIDSIKRSVALSEQGFLFSSSRTRVISHQEKRVLTKLSKIFNPYHCVLFQNLHTAHLGVLPLLLSGEFPKMNNNKTFKCLMDKHSHQSLKILIGIIQQFCEIQMVDMTDLPQLQSSLQKSMSNEKCPFIIMDSVGSMGKIYKIKQISELIEKYKGYGYYDDAHGMSIVGRYGNGYVLEQLKNKLNDRIFISTSLTKGFGAQGGAIMMPHKQQTDFIMQYATTYTFSGPLSIPTLQAINACCDIHLSQQITVLQQKLSQNIKYFDQKFNDIQYNPYQNSFLPFRIIPIGSQDIAIEYYKKLKDKNILVTCAVYPVVQVSKSILRITFSAKHQKNDIDYIVRQLGSLLKI